jgi:hypothetical protein
LKLSVHDSLTNIVGWNCKNFPPPDGWKPAGRPMGGWAWDGGGATGGVHGGCVEPAPGVPGPVGAGVPKGWGPWKAGG